MASALDPAAIDRAVQRAALDVRRSRAEAGAASPLEEHRAISRRTTYLELEGAPHDPVLSAARAWVRALILERVLWPEALREAAARSAEVVEVERPEPLRTSPRDVLRRVLAEESPGRRRAWAEALERGSGGVADAARIHAERRAEAAVRLDAPDLDAIEVPAEPRKAASDAARATLARTAHLAPSAGRWDDAAASALARDATEGWPVRPTAHWLLDPLRSSKLVDGLSLEAVRMPEALGASSFALAYARFGEAFVYAARPPSLPFSLSLRPFDPRPARRAALFASLTADPTFASRVLGLGRDRAREQARRVARGLVVALRLQAARVLLRGALLLPARDRAERFEEATGAALGAPVPAPLCGVVPKLRPHDAATFVGWLLAASDRQALVDRFDEDWFRNPRAGEALRHEEERAALAPLPGHDPLFAAVEVLVRTLEALG